MAEWQICRFISFFVVDLMFPITERISQAANRKKSSRVIADDFWGPGWVAITVSSSISFPAEHKAD